MATFKDGKDTIARSPYGGSFGGVVVPNYFSFSHSEGLVKSMQEFFRENDFSEVQITPPPEIYSKISSNYIEFNMMAKGFQLKTRDVTSVINLDSFNSDPFEILEKRSRTAVKKSIREGVIIVENSEDYSSFYDILKETKARHNAQPTHTLEELLKIRCLISNSIKLDMAYIDGNPAAGILYFCCNYQVLLCFYICHKKEYENYNPVNLLMYKGILWSKNNNFKYLDLGTTTQNMQPNYGLFKFKESFGSTGYFRDTFNWREDR
jgi:lipid II:glycine glycyltransferase (peptidoglycan interpeptide bridge formation enzyme)